MVCVRRVLHIIRTSLSFCSVLLSTESLECHSGFLCADQPVAFSWNVNSIRKVKHCTSDRIFTSPILFLTRKYLRGDSPFSVESGSYSDLYHRHSSPTPLLASHVNWFDWTSYLIWLPWPLPFVTRAERPLSAYGLQPSFTWILVRAKNGNGQKMRFKRAIQNVYKVLTTRKKL